MSSKRPTYERQKYYHQFHEDFPQEGEKLIRIRVQPVKNIDSPFTTILSPDNSLYKM